MEFRDGDPSNDTAIVVQWNRIHPGDDHVQFGYMAEGDAVNAADDDAASDSSIISIHSLNSTPLSPDTISSTSHAHIGDTDLITDTFKLMTTPVAATNGSASTGTSSGTAMADADATTTSTPIGKRSVNSSTTPEPTNAGNSNKNQHPSSEPVVSPSPARMSLTERYTWLLFVAIGSCLYLIMPCACSLKPREREQAYYRPAGWHTSAISNEKNALTNQMCSK